MEAWVHLVDSCEHVEDQEVGPNGTFLWTQHEMCSKREQQGYRY